MSFLGLLFHIDLIITFTVLFDLNEFTEIIFARLHNKLLLWFDETTASLWSPLLRKTWNANNIRLPYQSSRGRGRTVYGAVGGNIPFGPVQFFYAIG